MTERGAGRPPEGVAGVEPVAARLGERGSGSRVEIAGVSLTPRERQVFVLRAWGYNSLMVARVLGIEKKTVENHLGSIGDAVEATFSRDTDATLIMTGMVRSLVESNEVAYPDLPDQVRLTLRLEEIADLIREGLSISDIAHKVGISARTVEAPVSEIDERLGISKGAHWRELQRIGRLMCLALRPEAEIDIPDEVKLTLRQEEIANWTCEGVTEDEIAERLRISVHGVRTQLSVIDSVLGVDRVRGVEKRKIARFRLLTQLASGPNVETS